MVKYLNYLSEDVEAVENQITGPGSRENLQRMRREISITLDNLQCDKSYESFANMVKCIKIEELLESINLQRKVSLYMTARMFEMLGDVLKNYSDQFPHNQFHSQFLSTLSKGSYKICDVIQSFNQWAESMLHWGSSVIHNSLPSVPRSILD